MSYGAQLRFAVVVGARLGFDFQREGDVHDSALSTSTSPITLGASAFNFRSFQDHNINARSGIPVCFSKVKWYYFTFARRDQSKFEKASSLKDIGILGSQPSKSPDGHHLSG